MFLSGLRLLGAHRPKVGRGGGRVNYSERARLSVHRPMETAKGRRVEGRGWAACERTRKSGFLRARAAGGAKRAGDAVPVKRSKAELTAVVVTPRPRPREA